MDFEPQSPLGVWSGFPLREAEGLSIADQLIITENTVSRRVICKTEDGGANWATATSAATLEPERLGIQQDRIQRDRVLYYCAAELEAGEMEIDVQNHVLTITTAGGERVSLRRAQK